MRRYPLTRKSQHAKTGSIAITYSTKDNCPNSCPLKDAGCYASAGYHTNLLWDRITSGEPATWHSDKAPQTIAQHVAAIRELPRSTYLRLNIGGDLPIDDASRGNLKADQWLRLADAAPTTAGTYTHHRLTADNVEVLRAMAKSGLTVNVSADGMADAVAKRAKHALPTVATVPEDFRSTTHGEQRFVQCPATIKGSSVQCASCGGSKGPLCARADRDYIVAFPVHGAKNKEAGATVAA